MSIYNEYRKTRQSQKSPKRKRIFFLVGLGVILITCGFVALELTHTTHVFNQEEKPNPLALSGNANTKGLGTKGATTNTTTPAPANDTTKLPADSPVGAADLVAPSGTFANLYKTGLSDQMGSTCNTTPGASCQIIFTNGSLTRFLSKQLTDRGGAAFWSWKPNDADVNLTPGTWHITARATLGAQTKTTDNGALELEITP